MVSKLWTPLTGPRTRLSTRDGNCGQRRLDLPLMLWKVTQKRLKFPTSSPKSNPLLAVEELHFTKQGSTTSGDFHSHIVKIAKGCQFPNPEAGERVIRDAIFLGMNSQQDRDKAINSMNEEGKELTVEFLMNQLAVEDCNAHHKSLSQLDSISSVNFAAYDHRQNKGKSNKSK